MVRKARHEGDNATAELAPPLEPVVDLPAEQTEVREAGDEPEQPKRQYQSVRDWTTRSMGPVKYRKFTDDSLRIVGFKFDLEPREQLPQAVLDLLHENQRNSEGQSSGLIFRDTRAHGKVWTIPNDVEGRALADKIDFHLKQIAEKMSEGPERF